MVEGLLFVQKYDGHEGMCVVMFVLALCYLVIGSWRISRDSRQGTHCIAKSFDLTMAPALLF